MEAVFSRLFEFIINLIPKLLKMSSIEVATWNINGLTNYRFALKTFSIDQKLNLQSETNVTKNCYYYLNVHACYRADHPANAT